jgi:hypothetical protein|tara:strand:+ start:37 stop:465 length:429 start_codon:yes stop_codon:yes gene_type:complete
MKKKLTESDFWKGLKKNTEDYGVYWSRVETLSCPGIPDLHGMKDGVGFWIELKVHRLKSLKNILLRPHQIAWQTRYCSHGGLVVNLVAHPSSQTINIFHGTRAIEIAGQDTENHGSCSPDWSSTEDFRGAIDYIVSYGKQKQ